MNASPTPTRRKMDARITPVSSEFAAPYPAGDTCRVYSGSVMSAIALARLSPNWEVAPLVGALEGARAVTPERPLREQFEAAGDELGAPAGGVARGPAGPFQAKVEAARRGQHADHRQRHQRAPDVHGRAHLPAPGG